MKTETQISFLRNVWSTLPGRYQIHLHTLLVQFHVKLEQAVNLLDSLIGEPSAERSITRLIRKKGSVHKLDIALGKKCLMETIDDCRRWQQLFDPSWYLMLRMSNPVVDQQLVISSETVTMSTFKASRDVLWKRNSSPLGFEESSIFKRPGFDTANDRVSLSYSSLQFSKTRHDGVNLIIDVFRPNVVADLTTTRISVGDLAKLLRSGSEELATGFLKCAGVIEERDGDIGPPIFEFAFAVPRSLKRPRSLRDILLERSRPPPLDDRYRLARVLVRAVLSLHSYRWVHKNIRPETIVVFQDNDSSLGTPFLVGFETFRPVDDKSFFMGDESWEKNLYRHPRRQGLYPEDEYKMQHDVYSVGVCLLEIGLWNSFLEFNPQSSPSSILPIMDKLEMKEKKKRAFEVKSVFLDLAGSLLPSAMGNRYTKIVTACLTCLDQVDNFFGNETELKDDDEIFVGIRFIEKVSMTGYLIYLLSGTDQCTDSHGDRQNHAMILDSTQASLCQDF